MPFVDNAVPAGLVPQLDTPLDVVPPVPPFGRLFEAAMQRENPYVSTAEAAMQPSMSPLDPSYDPFRNITGYEDYASSFVGANSDADVLAVKSRIDNERNRNELLASGGWRGVVANLGAGLADPIMLVPVGGELVAVSRTGRVLESALRVGAVGGLTTAAQEAVLQGTQVTRPISESAIAVAGATLLGSVLGGAAGSLARPVDDGLARSASRAGEVYSRELQPSVAPSAFTIRRGYLLPTEGEGETRAYAILSEGQPVGGAHITTSTDGRTAVIDNIWAGDAELARPLDPQASRQVVQDFLRENPSVQEIREPEGAIITREQALAPTADSSTAGAMAVRGTTLDQETIASTLGVDRALAFSSPTLRLASSESVETRRLAQELADQPLVTRGNVEGIPSPVSVERRIALAQGPLAEAMVGLDDAFVRYRLGRARQFGDIARIAVRDIAGRAAGIMNYEQFAEAVGRAMRRGDASATPEVAEAARTLREKVFDPLKDRAIAAGLLPADVAPATAASYLSRIYNTQRIAAQRPQFEQIITDWLASLRDPKLAGLSELELRDISRQITDQLLHAAPGRTNYSPVPLVRGPLRERTLNIPDVLIEDYLEHDVRRIARSYTRTMAADTALTEAFGRADMEPMLDKVRESYAQLREGVTSERALRRLDAGLKDDLRDLAAVRDRVRGTFGLPEDPDGLWNRAYHVIRDLNYLRLLGGMTVSALPDLGRTVMVHGLMRVIGDGIVPLLTSFRQYRLASGEVKLAGNALDMVLDTRAMALADMLDDYGRWSRYERGLKAMTEQFGVVTLMAPWNAALKQFVGVVSQTRALRAIEALSEGRPVAAAERTRLAHLGIGETEVERIAEQFAKHGERNGVWWANTAAWEDTRAADAFRAALSKEVDIAIVTPGQEKPLWMSTGMGKVVGQFRSFAFASTQRVLLTGLQQRDMATLNGILLMTALGTGATWIRRQTDPHAQPLPDPGTAAGVATWVKEGVDRAGLTGWLFDANNMVEKLTRGAVGASALTGGPPMSRYASRNAVESLLGPTVGAISDTAQAIGAATGGEWTDGDTRAVRRMLPYQNLIGVRHLFDMAEEGLKH